MCNQKNEPQNENTRPDLMDYAEDFLSGVISFVGMYFATFWDIMFRPQHMQFKQEGTANHASQGHLRPLTFLLASSFLLVLPYFKLLELAHKWGGDTPTGYKLERLLGFLTSAVQNVEVVKILILLTPIILFVAAYSRLNVATGAFLKKELVFSTQLRMNSYITGSLAFLLAPWTACVLLLVTKNFDQLKNLGPIHHITTIIVFIIIAAIIYLSYRYVLIFKEITMLSWVQVIFTIIVSAGICFVGALLLFTFF